jgi:hypothetical protein
MDLEVGAVDELLVGECVVSDKDQGENNPLCFLFRPFCLSTLLLTNNNHFKMFIPQS